MTTLEDLRPDATARGIVPDAAVIAHLVGLVGSNVEVTLEIQAEIPDGAPEHVVRVVTEKSRTLKFSDSSGFEEE